MARALLLTVLVAVVLFFITQNSKKKTVTKEKEATTVTKQKEVKQKPITPEHQELLAEEEQFARKVFRSLHQNNAALWLSLYQNDLLRQMTELKEKYADQPLVMAKKMQEFALQNGAAKTEIHSRAFVNLQQQAVNEGLNLTTAKYLNFIARKYKTTNGEDSLSGNILMQTNNAQFVLEHVEMVRKERTYYLQQTGSIKKVSDE